MRSPFDTARDLRRTNEIASVLVRRGLSDVAHRLGLGRGLRRVGRWLHVERAARFETLSTPERMRRALEELGPTFVKLGQVLAGRTDLLPPEWTAELGRLREHATPVPWSELRAQLEEDLGAAPETLFTELDERPLAAASIAQVHRARLDGRPVVLKVRRPGIRATVEADLRLLDRLAEVAETELPDARRWRAREIVRQFARTLRDELDLRIEARNATRIAEQIADEPRVVVPRIHERFTGERLLVTDLLDVPSASEWIARERRADASRARVDPRAIAALGADVVLEMVFVHGLYHADPHPGNVFLFDDGRIGLIDFGMVGHLSEARRDELARLLLAVARRSEADVVEILLAWSRDDEPVDRAALAQACGEFLDRWHGLVLGEIDVAALLADVAALVRAHGLVLPPDVALLLKVFVTLESFGRELDPEFDMAAHAAPFVERVVRARRGPLAQARRAFSDVASVLTELPRGLRDVLATARRGGVRVELDLKRLDSFGRQIDRSANRLTMGMVTSALIVGTSISLTASGGPRLGGLSFFGVLGFASSVVLGLGLLLSIRRARRR